MIAEISAFSSGRRWIAVGKTDEVSICSNDKKHLIRLAKLGTFSHWRRLYASTI